MWFLTRFVGIIFVLNAVLMGGVMTYRTITPTRLETLLAIDDRCGMGCWFGFMANRASHRHDVEIAMNAAGAKTINTRGTNMRFSHFEAAEPNTIGTIAVELAEGYADTMCFFPNPNILTIGDVFATFGPPDSFWVYLYRSRSVYEMLYVYDEVEILIEGAADFDWSVDQSKLRLGDDVTVSQLCTARDITAGRDIRPQQRPEWRGFNVSILAYQANVYVSETNAPFSIQ